MSIIPPEEFDTLLIDGDLLVFSSCAALEYGNDPADVQFHKIATNIDARIANMRRRLGAKNVIILLSGKKNYRFVVQPDYKANREGAWIPYNLDNGKGYVQNQYECIIEEGLEADDWCGILGGSDKVVTATIDKDIPTVSGWHYRWETQHAGEKLFYVDNTGTLECKVKSGNKKKITGTGKRFFFWQLLTGDPTDGIMGCGKSVRKVYKTGAKAGQSYNTRQGVGAVKAYELLKHAITPAKCLTIVMDQYKKVFGKEWQTELIKNGRVLHMTHDKKDNMIPLWTWHQEVNTEEDAAEFLEITGQKAGVERMLNVCADRINDSWFDIDKQEIVSMRG